MADTKRVLQNLITRLREFLTSESSGLLRNGGPDAFAVSDGLDLQQPNLPGVAEACSREEADRQFTDAVDEAKSRLYGSAAQAHGIPLMQLERAFRDLHKSSIRDVGHAAARMKGIGSDKGAVQSLIDTVTNYEQAAGRSDQGS